jgi:phage shock protein A
MLTRKQEFSFAPHQPFSKLVDFAVAQEKDVSLTAEVHRYRRADDRLRRIARHMAKLREEVADVTHQKHLSAVALASANAFSRVAPRILYDSPPPYLLADNKVQEGRTEFEDP